MANLLRSEAHDIYQRWESYQSQRSEWAREAAEDEDFFLGRQWSAEDERIMRDKGMGTIVVNRTMPIILQECAIFTSKRAAFRALPRDDSDVKVASLWSDMMAYIWQNSNGDLQWQQAVLDYFVKGAGYMMATIDPYADDGRGEVVIKSIPVWDVYPDPNAREIDLSDAKAIIVSRVMDEATLRFMYPDKGELISQAASSVESGPILDKPYTNPALEDEGYGISTNDYSFHEVIGKNRRLRILEHYEKVRVPHYRTFNTKTGVTQVVPKASITNPKAFFGNDITYANVWRTQIRLTATLGSSVVLYKTMLPTSHYPIVPLFLHHNRNPYPRGDVNVIKGMQKEVNKRRAIMLHNATLAGNYRIKAQKGAIFNKKQWEEQGTRPSSILEWNQGFEEPKEMLPGQIPNAWIQLESEGKGDMEYSLSVFAHMMGSGQDAPETYRGLLALEEAGQRKLKHKIQNANNALRILGLVCIDYAQAIYKMPKIMRIAGEENSEYRELYINQPVTDPQTGRLKTINDISVGRYDLVVVDGTSMPTNRMALLNLYLDLYDRGIVDKAEVLKKTDVVDREAVLARLGEMQQMAGRVEQLQEALKDIEGLNQTLRRQLQQSEIRYNVVQGSEDIRDAVRQTRAQQLVLKDKAKNDLALINKTLELERDKVRLEGQRAALSLEAHKLALTKRLEKSHAGRDSD